MHSKKRHINIPIFIPHEGCPNSCVFCNQRTITNTDGGAGRDIRSEIEACLSTIDTESCDCEIAFFGGSFTGIDRNDMLRLLSVAKEYIDSGKVQSVRLSTRPDFISEEILGILKEYGVRHIELGIQSLDDRVLLASRRGHSADTTIKACKMIVERGFSLTGQMMLGLPGATLENEIETAKGICSLGADSARIYPAVVFYDTELCAMSKNGLYTPLTNEQATVRGALVYEVFVKNGVKLLRIGLQASDGLCDDKIYGGAAHSAIGELIVGRYYFNLMCEKCRILFENGTINKDAVGFLTVFCAIGEASKVSGQKRVNKLQLQDYFRENGIILQDIKVKEKKDITENNVEIEFSKVKKQEVR